MISVTLGEVTSLNFSIQGVNSTCNLIFLLRLEWFSSKRGAFQFSPIDIYLMRGHKLDLALGHQYQNC